MSLRCRDVWPLLQTIPWILDGLNWVVLQTSCYQLKLNEMNGTELTGLIADFDSLKRIYMMRIYT